MVGVGGMHPGHALLIENVGAWDYTGGGFSHTVTGNWLWVYNGTDWQPAIDFPEVARAKFDGASEVEMTEGLITKEMLWKLKNIQAGAQVNTVYSVAGKTGAVLLAKSDVGLGNVDNTPDSTKNVLSATKLTTSRKIANVSFDGTTDIAIPFANLSSKPTTIDGYGITDARPNANESARGLIKISTQAEALAATDDTTATTPLKVKQIVDKFATLQIYETAPDPATIPEGKIILVLEETI